MVAQSAYNVNEWFGVEFAGQLSPFLKVDDRGMDSGSALSLKITPKFTYQVSDFVGLFFKAGLSLMSYSAEFDDVESTNDFNDSISWTGVGYTAGIGIQFSVASNVYVRTTYDYSAGTLKSNDRIDDGYFLYDVVDVDATYNEFKIGAHYQF